MPHAVKTSGYLFFFICMHVFRICCFFDATILKPHCPQFALSGTSAGTPPRGKATNFQTHAVEKPTSHRNTANRVRRRRWSAPKRRHSAIFRLVSLKKTVTMKGEGMRGLAVFIADIRNCKSIAGERRKASGAPFLAAPIIEKTLFPSRRQVQRARTKANQQRTRQHSIEIQG